MRSADTARRLPALVPWLAYEEVLARKTRSLTRVIQNDGNGADGRVQLARRSTANAHIQSLFTHCDACRVTRAGRETATCFWAAAYPYFGLLHWPDMLSPTLCQAGTRHGANTRWLRAFDMAKRMQNQHQDMLECRLRVEIFRGARFTGAPLVQTRDFRCVQWAMTHSMDRHRHGARGPLCQSRTRWTCHAAAS